MSLIQINKDTGLREPKHVASPVPFDARKLSIMLGTTGVRHIGRTPLKVTLEQYDHGFIIEVRFVTTTSGILLVTA